ncbi:MAG TPA: helix-turn-helix transcriptional regulator [Chloroflexia bacterium]|jgi:ribosome-binding protein aMBF1 (putative translation factor)
MITNEREYRITKSAIRGFEESLKRMKTPNPDEDPNLLEAMRDSMQGEVEFLRAQLAEYDAYRSGEVKDFTVEFEHFAEALIRARIATQLTQKQLAELVGIKEQQIQRYEAEEYEAASFARLKEIVWALGLKVELTVTFPIAEQEEPAAEYRTRLQGKAS